MNKFRFILLFALLTNYCFGQNTNGELGIKIGLQNHNITPLETLTINGVSDVVAMSVNEIDYGFHAGIYGRFKLIGLIWEPALLLNSQGVAYNVTTTDMIGTEVVSVKKEYYQDLDLPLLIGYKIAFLKIHAGPVAHIHLNSTSELFDIEGYDQKFKEARFGYQAGIGLEFRKIRFTVNYEGNFSNFGNHLIFDGTSYSFSEKPSRLIASVGVAF